MTSKKRGRRWRRPITIKVFKPSACRCRRRTRRARSIALQVTELKVGRLRVKNSRYFDLDTIKNRAGSLKEGSVPNFNDVTKDIVALNQWPDRRVTPALRAGVAPGTVDVDLNVEDTAPIHGTIEYNNRQSPSTTDHAFERDGALRQPVAARPFAELQLPGGAGAS